MNDMRRWKAYYEAEEDAGYRRYTNDRPRFRTCFKLVGRSFGSLLDAGCGEGHWLQYLSKRFPEAKYTGIEIAANRAAKARDRLPGVRILQGDIANIAFPGDSFDVVTCMEALEHVPDWSTVLAELIRVAKKTVFLTVPYREKVAYEICIHCHKPTPGPGTCTALRRALSQRSRRAMPCASTAWLTVRPAWCTGCTIGCGVSITGSRLPSLFETASSEPVALLVRRSASRRAAVRAAPGGTGRWRGLRLPEPSADVAVDNLGVVPHDVAKQRAGGGCRSWDRRSIYGAPCYAEANISPLRQALC